jgi:hypothetical protein
LDAEDTLRMVGAAFGVRVKDISKADVLMALEAYLVSQTSQGKRCLLIVDEAQNLNARAVEELRMLSNFQLGQQALLQTFLVGQPEFRAILQSPDMQQLRQRVAATCHIGPLDLEETRGYIEHRLKCAGSFGRPTFDSDAFESIFHASGGIPRRINLICDRLLLLGFLGSKDTFGREHVAEVMNEIDHESAMPAGNFQTRRSEWAGSAGLDGAPSDVIDIDLADLQATPGLCHAIADQIDSLTVEQHDGRLKRLEGSVLRSERINLEILAMLKKLVLAATVPGRGAGK